MYWNLFDVFVIVCEYILLCTVWSCWVQNIHHSFVGWTGIERSCPQLPSSPRRIGLRAVVRRKPTAARRVSGEKRLRPNAAALCGAQRPRRGCGAFDLQKRGGGRQEQQWPGPQSGKQAPEIESRTWGTSKSDKNVTGLKFLHFQ